MALIIAGDRSGVGKTTVMLTLLASLCRRQLQVQSFKVGPDYIDPMFHQHVTGRACRNLDPVLTSETYVQQCFAHHSQDVDYSLVEGVMGLFDGVFTRQKAEGETALRGGFPPQATALAKCDRRSYPKDRRQKREDKRQRAEEESCLFQPFFASTAHIAKLLNLAVILVVDSSRLSGSIAPIVHGYRSFNPQINIAGVVLNRVGSDRHLELLKAALEPLQIPIFGVLRRQDSISIPDRHLGLVPTSELPEIDTLIDRLADLGDTCFDWDKLLPLLKLEPQSILPCTPAPLHPCTPAKIPIAVAYDQAFNFYYQDNLDLLQQLGAEIVFWSPLQDATLPEGMQGMYFGGGFPEVFAQQLAINKTARESVKNAILAGMPTIAECGGLMYLCEAIVDTQGKTWSMVGVLPTQAIWGERLTLGYRRAVALQASPLVSAGATVYGHEFHRSRLTINTDKALLQTYRYDSGESTDDEGWVENLCLHASYLHMHWGATPELPQRFLDFCIKFRGQKKQPYLN